MIFAVAVILVAVLALASCGCEHVYEEMITVRPTCTEAGEKTFTCALCGDTYTDVAEPTGHNYTETVVEPTCSAEGYTEHTCACGDSYRDTTTEKAAHYFVDEVVTPATCSTGGYTMSTCYVCGEVVRTNETEKDPSMHKSGMVLAELSAEQAAANPHAIGISAQGCPVCGEITSVDAQEAVLVYLNFDGTFNVDSYVGSAVYESAVSSKDLSLESQKIAAAMIDSQKNLDLRAKSNIFYLTEDGKLAIDAGNALAGFANTLSLGSERPAILDYTISFDMVVNATPKTETSFLKYTEIFGIHSNKSYGNNRPICLKLAGVDLDPAADVAAYELMAQSVNRGKQSTSVNVPTGYAITLGKEYSFKLVVHTDEGGKGSYVLYVKAVEETAYTELCTCEIVPDHVDPYATFIAFNYYLGCEGNTVDNLLITAPLAK